MENDEQLKQVSLMIEFTLYELSYIVPALILTMNSVSKQDARKSLQSAMKKIQHATESKLNIPLGSYNGLFKSCDIVIKSHLAGARDDVEASK